MNRIRFPLQSAQLTCLLLGLSLFLINAPAQARGDDWVLVERFEQQLQQAQSGDSQAMYDVGVMYELGRGTKTDPVKAVEWLNRAIGQNNHNARARLGALYYEGKLVTRDLGKARTLLRAAAEANVPSAQFHLAQMYETGQGVDPDAQQALHWYQLASKGGYYEARARIRELSATQNDYSPAPAAAVSPAPAPAAKPARTDLLGILLSGNWQRNDRSAGFLPSSNTSCERLNGKKLRCRSSAQQRDTGYAVITYMTQAVLTQNGTSNTFDIVYRNTVLNTADSQKQLVPADEESNARSSVSQGQQTEHMLQCKLESNGTVVCVKDKIATQTYKNVARAQ